MQTFLVPVSRFAGPRGGAVSLFGPTPQSTAQETSIPNDAFGFAIERFSLAEVRLREARQAVLNAYNAAVTARVPLDSVGLADLAGAYNQLRRQLAQDLAYFVEFTSDTIEAAQDSFGWNPFGTPKIDVRQKIGNANAWADALLARAPALRPGDLTGVNFGNPAAIAVGVPLAKGLLVIVGIGVAGYFAAQAVRAFNDRATASTAEADRIRVLAEGKLALIREMKAAGLNAEQISAELARQADLNKPPDTGAGLGTVIAWLAGAAALATAAWFATRPRGRR